MNAQIPLPSFEDIRKILQFWIDQQDKWFYFETATLLVGSNGQSEVPNPIRTHTQSSRATNSEINHYIQTRIIGIINDVVSYPPSLLLRDVTVFTARLSYEHDRQASRLLSTEKRAKYGLVFSQITQYEPIDDIGSFLKGDPRINDQGSR